MANLIISVPTVTTQEHDIFLKPFLAEPQISQLPMKFTFGNMPREIFFNNNLDKILGAGGTCDWVSKGDNVNFTKKTLNPVPMQAQSDQCYSVLLKKLFGNNLPDGWQRGELSPEVLDFMTNQFTYAINRDFLSLLTLGDTAVTPDDYYSLIDGLYTKLLAGATAVDGTVKVSTTIDASALSTTNFFATMNSIYNAQSRQLKRVAKNQKTWIWTEAVYDAYLNYLEVTTQNTAGATQTQYVVDGLTATSFKGIPIVVLGIVDERLETDFLSGSPATATDPYRIILTTDENHHILMDITSFNDIDIWHEKKDDKVYVRGSVLWDYQYGYGDLNVIAGWS